MNVRTTIKQTVTVFATVAGLAVVGLPSPASALYFDAGHLAFVIYGGEFERYQNLGPGSADALEGTVEFGTTVSAEDLELVQRGAPLGPRYALHGISGDRLSFYTTSRIPVSAMLSDPTGLTLDATFPAQAGDVFGFWGFARIAASTGGRVIEPSVAIIPAADANSFTSILRGEGLLNGNLGFQAHASFDQPLYIVKFNADGEYPEPVEVGTVLLTSNGQLRITPYNAEPVPVPAAAILFGSGLVGLVGFARRQLSKTAL
ncbi:MAG: hypothetical protein NNA18_11720 [Nitrospira sp.]|nr:hypothetical protein [Nitrospira sp.]